MRRKVLYNGVDAHGIDDNVGDPMSGWNVL